MSSKGFIDGEGRVDINDSTRDVKIHGIGGSVNISTASGDIRTTGGFGTARFIARSGDIICESELGKGTTFRVLFPKFEGEITDDSEGIVKFTLPNAKTGNYIATVKEVSHPDYAWNEVETTNSCLLNKDGTID